MIIRDHVGHLCGALLIPLTFKMQDYSDTESEPELPINTTPKECTHFSSHPCQDDPLLALQKIKRFDLTAIQRASPALLPVDANLTLYRIPAFTERSSKHPLLLSCFSTSVAPCL